MAPAHRTKAKPKAPAAKPGCGLQPPKLESAPQKYEPRDWEKTLLERQMERRRTSASELRIKLRKTPRTLSYVVDHPDPEVGLALLAEALGTSDLQFVSGVMEQLMRAAASQGDVAEADINFLFSIVKDIRPRDQMEAMLAAQIALTHQTIMVIGRRIKSADTWRMQDSTVNATTKLQRTFTMQMEALKRYRSGGEQKVTVQHVTVNEGGQAVVGHVTQARTAAAPPPPRSRRRPALVHAAAETIAIDAAEPKDT